MKMNSKKFIQSLYIICKKYLKELYKSQNENKKELLQKIANLLLTYTIDNNALNLSKAQKNVIYTEFSKMLLEIFEAQIKNTNDIIYKILRNVTETSFEHYGIIIDKKVIEKIIDENFKDKPFSERVWENENEVCKKLHKEVKDFLEGTINANEIKSRIEKQFNTERYNANRLVDTEIARCQSKAFDRFCEEVGVKKVIYRATLCNSCDECLSHDGEIFDFKDKPELPKHPFCKCYYDIEE